MTVTSVDKDFDRLTLTLTADFDAPIDQVWEVWADPRQLEQWWGPPHYPAKVEEHDLTPGGDVSYYMTSPDREIYHGWWRVMTVDPPHSLEFTEGFADDDRQPMLDAPITMMRMQLTEHGDGTRMELHPTFDSREEMEQLMNMGMSEGLQEAVDQIDDLLTD